MPLFKVGMTSKPNHGDQEQDKNNFSDEKLQGQFNSCKEGRAK